MSAAIDISKFQEDYVTNGLSLTVNGQMRKSMYIWNLYLFLNRYKEFHEDRMKLHRLSVIPVN